MSQDRPDYIACIDYPIAGPSRRIDRVWCERPRVGFTLSGLDHAAACILRNTHVVPCPECLREAIRVMAKEGA